MNLTDDLFGQFLLEEPEIQDPETEKLAFLDRGYLTSAWAKEIDLFPNRLVTHQFNNYLSKGVLPDIDLNFLSFLHEDITEACLCLIDQQKNSYWFGRRPIEPVEMWSATKFLAVYYLLSIIDSRESDVWQIKDEDNNLYSFPYLVDLIFTYARPDLSSNSLALMFKSFYPPLAIERWLHDLTGDNHIIFRGGYGEPSFIAKPVLQQNNQTLLEGFYLHQGQNLLSAYSLTRSLTQLAWFDVFTERYNVIIKAMAKDCARYLDVALAKRLSVHLSEPVILSKMGFGRSKIRNRSELVYTALLSCTELSFCFTFKAALNLENPAQEARYLDARMVTEVTKTIGELGC